jgi:hypothetical protein
VVQCKAKVAKEEFDAFGLLEAGQLNIAWSPGVQDWFTNIGFGSTSWEAS